MNVQSKVSLFPESRHAIKWSPLGAVIPFNIADDPAKIASMVGADWEILSCPLAYLRDKSRHTEIPGAMAQIRSDTKVSH